MDNKTIILLFFIIGGGFIFFSAQNITNNQITNNPDTQATNNTIKIATFNIQIFGISKREKPEVMDVLKKIVRNFDVVAIQEVRDSSETTVDYFLDQINSMPGSKYDVVEGPRVGRTSSKEQYAFYYQQSKISYTLNSSYTYEDNGDLFEREPFIARFSSGGFDFVLINIHTKPEDAFNEINALKYVINDARLNFPDEGDFIVLGDFNADCDYFSEQADLSLLEDDEFYWVISDNADTTTKSTVCTYDRMVFNKAETSYDYTSEWGVFNFGQVYNLNQTFVEDISDHYPIWATFYTTNDTK